MLYIDDIKMICKSIEQIQILKKNIESEFNINNIDSISYYLEIKMMRNCKIKIIILSQKNYIRKILELLNINKNQFIVIFNIFEKY